MAANKRLLMFLLLLAVALAEAVASAGEFYKEAMFIGGYSDRDQWVGKWPGLKNSVGFEFYEKFSNDYGDFLTADLQVRMAYDSVEDSREAFGVEIHNAWLEYKIGLGQSLRFGHFDPAFGLEPVLDTHSTLMQTLAFKNVGFKKDWGVGYKSYIGDYDYQVAAQLGSGMGLRRKDGSFLLTGRIGTPQTSDTQVGLSFLYGQTLGSKESWTFPAGELVSGSTVRRKRIGVDVQFPLGLFDFKAEFAAGENDGTAVGGGLAELGYTVPEQQNLRLKFQTMYWSDDWDEKKSRDLTLSTVAEYSVSSTTKVRLGYFHDLYSRSDEDRAVMLQFYYFGS